MSSKLDANIVSWLKDFKEVISINPNAITQDEKRKYWKIVGQIKRMEKPEWELVSLASDIRETLYKTRFGEVKSISKILPLNTITALAIIVSVYFISIPEYRIYGLVGSWLTLSLLSYIYCHVLKLNAKQALLVFTLLVFSTFILDLILIVYSTKLFLHFNQIGLLLIVPTLYLHGRYLGGKFAGIKFDGVSRDIYFLLSMKVNYESYLSASPDKRQWIFFFGGIGTVITSFLIAFIQYYIFGEFYLVFFGIALLLAELLDFYGLAGRLSGGELHHFRRERKIIADWRNSLVQLT